MRSSYARRPGPVIDGLHELIAGERTPGSIAAAQMLLDAAWCIVEYVKAKSKQRVRRK